MGKDTQKTTVLTSKSSVGREFSAGGVVFRKFKIRNLKYEHLRDVEIRWLVAESMPSKLFPEPVWRLPKGWIDDVGADEPGPMASGKIKADEESLKKAAVREVAEEGGIEAVIKEKIGTLNFFYTHPVWGKIMKFVTFYLMEYVKDLPQGFDEETSEIAWLPYSEAYKKITFAREKEMLEKANELLAK